MYVRSGGDTRLVSPLPLGMGSRNVRRAYFKEEDDLNADDLVLQTSSTRSVYAVHGVVEHLMAYEVQGGLLDVP